jgi:hypothetical protein
MRAMWAAIVLIPTCVAAESHGGSSTQGALASATARVEFKIIIPPMLYLRLADGAASVVTNGRAGMARAQCVLNDTSKHLICTAATP